jgi:hypothetical protein
LSEENSDDLEQSQQNGKISAVCPNCSNFLRATGPVSRVEHRWGITVQGYADCTICDFSGMVNMDIIETPEELEGVQ